MDLMIAIDNVFYVFVLCNIFFFFWCFVVQHTLGDVVVAVNGFPVLAESHKALVDLMSSQLKLHLVLLYQVSSLFVF